MAERMSDVEALIWNLEKDPYLDSSFTNVTLLDRPLDFERLRRRMARAAVAVPRLRQRVVAGLGRLAPPAWHDDPDFDLDHHVRRLGVPGQGSERDLFELAGQVAQTPFDRTRPLWQFTVADGLADGRGAIIQKFHHTVTDGEGGVRMSVEFIDLTRDPPEPEPLEQAPEPRAQEPPATLLSTIMETVGYNVRRQTELGRRLADEAVALATHPERLAEVRIEAVETVRSLIRQAAVTDRARSPLWTARSLRRRFETLRVPFAPAKQAAAALGGSLNDFFVAGAVGGAAAYHRAQGVDAEDFRITMPVSRRAAGSVAGGNAFAPTRLLVPAAIADPAARFMVIRDRLQVAKSERALGLVESLAGLVNVLPTSVLVRLARQQAETIDFATSNVRGAPMELFIAGARVESNHPIAPTAGTAFNLTLLSYNGSLDMGLNVDVAAVAEPALLRRCMEEEFAELLEAGKA